MPRNANANVNAEVQQTTSTRMALPRICDCCQRTFNARVVRSSIAQMCEACFDEAGFENAHNDGHHDQTADAGCHICTDTDPHASFRTRAASGQQGQVLKETDGRLSTNAPAIPEGAERVKILTFRTRNTRFAGLEASVIKRDTHTWQGYSAWALVQVDGVAQRRWFMNTDVQTIPAPRAPRARRARATTETAA